MSAKRWVAAILLSVSSATSFALNAVINSFDLVDLIDANEVIVLDIREQATEFKAGHIPGSRHLPYTAFRGPDHNPGQLLSLDVLSERLESIGLTPKDAIVIVHDGVTTSDFGAAARVYWTLKSVGFESLSILNGGFRGYQKDGFDLASGDHEITPTVLALRFNGQWYAGTRDVQDAVEGAEGLLVDARLAAFYEGTSWHAAAGRPGAIPGANLIPFERFFDAGTPLLKDDGDVLAIVTDYNLQGPQVITYCNTGHWAATNWFVLSEVARIPNVKLYAESMVEWSNTGAPMVNVPSALQFAMLKTKSWLDRLVN
ncbi:MAG: rhodanese-like domain-containing protein [Litorivicinaceae bacterium]|nr:rhodanese-like domain-containing protein [Litorivicinaceae bacterium]